MNYKERLFLPLESPNDEIIFYTQSGLEVAKNYIRVVIGGRGPYIEFQEIIGENIYIPKNQLWRVKNSNCYYIEWRTKDKSFVKLYYQKKVVDYADYQIGLWYISPFDLTSNLYPELIRKLK